LECISEERDSTFYTGWKLIFPIISEKENVCCDDGNCEGDENRENHVDLVSLEVADEDVWEGGESAGMWCIAVGSANALVGQLAGPTFTPTWRHLLMRVDLPSRL